MNIEKILTELSNSCAIGSVTDAVKLLEKQLSKYGTIEKSNGLTMSLTIKGKDDYTLLIDAHIDEVGFVVTDVSDSGFLTVSNLGGIDLRHLAAKPVTIHGKKKVCGVFVSTPPHLDKNDAVPENISKIKIDTGLGNSAKDIISVGDYVTYRQTADILNGDTVCGKSLDNRAGVATLILLAERLHKKRLPITVEFLFSDAEELGLRGAKTAAFKSTADEAIIIDVSFGDGPDIPATKCGILGAGGMIGMSPVLNRDITDKLILLASDNAIPYQNEVMGGKTSTNADAVSICGGGIPSGLISIPLRNMHTDVETVKLDDIISVADLLEKYILSGGVKNA